MLKIFISLLLSILLTSILHSQVHITKREILGKVTPKGGTTNSYKLREEVFEAFKTMQKAARKDGIEILIVSGFRSYQRQSSIWNRKFKKYKAQGLSDRQAANKIVEYSTYPGTSRHHWGTDFDIIQKVPNRPKNLLLETNYGSEGPFCDMFEWMQKNAAKYGFYLVYTDDPERAGFSYEPWHYTYKPTSISFLKEALRLKVYEELLDKANTSLNSDYFSTHILGINKLLKP